MCIFPWRVAFSTFTLRQEFGIAYGIWQICTGRQPLLTTCTPCQMKHASFAASGDQVLPGDLITAVNGQRDLRSMNASLADDTALTLEILRILFCTALGHSIQRGISKADRTHALKIGITPNFIKNSHAHTHTDTEAGKTNDKQA